MGKKIISLLLAVLLTAALCFAVSAEEGDLDYEGLLDPITGQPVQEGAQTGDTNVIQIENNVCGYDTEKELYVNYTGGLSYYSTCPPGAILSSGEKVSITLPGGLTGTLFRNGDEVADPNLQEITEPGIYLLELVGTGNLRSTFSFRILKALAADLTEIRLPTGFEFDSITLDGEPLATNFTNYINLISDGGYELVWTNETIEKTYKTVFTLDTIPPTLLLAEVRDGQAFGPVSIADLEAGCYIVLTDKSGNVTTIQDGSSPIANAGTYQLTVYDQAGNNTSYQFTLHVYLNLSATVAILLVLAIVFALYLYAKYVRKHPRVG